ncbi:peptidase [Kribbella sandramycini]|uniref:Peptidase n=1 Tax=Kribbella sandramycini TaxID=60450 RepID=A0A7Y4KWV0_9ACTN|nr:peptidase [Kribbella sandramycini]MBB6570006.1 V8-like Glu-specific endopeptidase [Kribbella sandramycini]NOL40170.1 peptidase [Kribbella sandramycini]
MRIRPVRSALLATACVVGLAVPLAGTTATAVQPSTTHEAATTKAEQARVSGFWTPERMRSAVPIDQLLTPKQRLSGGTVAAGEPTTVAPTAMAPTAFPSGGAPWTGGGKIVSTEGRVFFTYTGRTASCSGTAVTSGNKSTVITAGHCVKLEGAFHTNWVFVPAYNNGATPYGTWTAKKTYATAQWVASEDINYDVGAAVVNPLNGQNLTDVVGGQGVAFNQARGQNMYAFGYPAAAPYDGSKLIYCSGKVFNALISDGLGMTCDMTGGSSGGGWFLQFNEAAGTGIVNSVNSYKINFIPTWMFGPYFGADAQSVYNTAQAG